MKSCQENRQIETNNRRYKEIANSKMDYLISRLIVMVSNQQGVVGIHRKHQWNRIENSEIDLHKHVQINFGKVKNNFVGGDSSFKREWCGTIIYKYAK